VSNALDVVGDVHGQFDKLVALLKHLGYRDTGGTWRHLSRSVIFVGDPIDRGPKQLATVDLVRRMVEAGSARSVMGNHEFNAIAWATPDPEHPGEFLRPHGKAANLQQHQAFLTEFEGTPEYSEVIAWFKTLPLWLDFGGLRVVHACWHQASIDQLQPLMGSNLIVIYLEDGADRRLLGELRAWQVMSFWTQDHYRWLYRTVLSNRAQLRDLVRKYHLEPMP
jgi:hypothetical protein